LRIRTAPAARLHCQIISVMSKTEPYTHVRSVKTTDPLAIDDLKRDWPKGCAPPTGYVEWHNWAEAQDAHGLKQTRCKRCALWFFPQEAPAHINCTDK
jgi:hypothetical protein